MEQNKGIQAMSDKQNAGGSIFPCESYGLRNGKETTIPTNGLSLRDWFAAQALKVILEDPRTRIPQAAALDAYCIADAMLAAREGGAK
jgi:hypothetical protein